jgi:hypothetical protein
VPLLRLRHAKQDSAAALVLGVLGQFAIDAGAFLFFAPVLLEQPDRFLDICFFGTGHRESPRLESSA